MATAIDMRGHNAPPPIEAHKMHIEELFEEAKGFLDGEPIANQDQADAIGKLLGMLREARKGADEQRATEKRPHDEAGKAVQAAWKPLIDLTATAESVAKKALAPWLEARETEARAAAEAARREADEKAAAARAAQQAAATDDLAARHAADEAAKIADRANKAANRAEKAKPMAAGHGRAVSLRSVWSATLADPVAALRYYKTQQADELKAWLQDQADRDVRAGTRVIPGFTITEERIAQ